MTARALILSFAVLSLLTACPRPPELDDSGGDSLGTIDTNLPEWDDDSTTLRFVHLSPDVAPGCSDGTTDYSACLDVTFNGAPLPATTAFPFGASTGPIAGFPSGATTIDLTAAGTTDLAYGIETDSLAPQEPVLVVLRGVDAIGSVGHDVLSDDIGSPDDGYVRVRVHHLMYGLESLPLHITDPLGTTIATVAHGTPEIVDTPPSTFDSDGDSVPDSNLWFVDLTPAGQPQAIPFLWHMDLDGDGVAEDTDTLDLFILPVPDVLPPLPIALVHSPTSNVPGQFPPYSP